MRQDSDACTRLCIVSAHVAREFISKEKIYQGQIAVLLGEPAKAYEQHARHSGQYDTREGQLCLGGEQYLP